MSHGTIGIVIADDHEVYRDGLKTLLSKAPRVKLLGEASDGLELVEVCRELRPNVVLADILMPVMDGIAATRIIRQELPQTEVIALSMFNDDHLVIDMLQAGAKGYLIKNAGKQEIIDAIESVHRNVPYYCSSTTLKLARMLASSKFPVEGAEKKPSFTPREQKIIQLICEGQTSKEIADTLFLSIRTVEEYRLNIREKMGVTTPASFVIYCLRNGLFEL